ncbi:RNA polymerase sigma factor [Cryptosporangium arvum]|uniref:RNA polymerase sigma factor n=1 Tax=Cryptosporangium arvum TaxID=80871 RepID=UPI0012EEBEB2|nr:hypothetical protein [Cryptosporangium arvum]
MATIGDALPFGLREDAAVLAALREGNSTEFDAVPGTRASWAGGFRRHAADFSDGLSPAGLDALFDRYHQWAYGLFMRTLRDHDQATLALGQTLGNVASARLTRPEQVRLAVARAAYENGLRVGEGRSRVTRRTPDATTSLLVGIMDAGGDGELRRLVWRAMETLSYRERLLFELEWHDGLDVRELVTVIGGRNAQAVLGRARDRIRATLTTAVAVWYGSERCMDLRRLVRHAGASGGRPGSMRSVIERHLYGTRTEVGCKICADSQDKYALSVLGAALPVFGVPEILREHTIEIALEYRRGLRLVPLEHPSFAVATSASTAASAAPTVVTPTVAAGGAGVTPGAGGSAVGVGGAGSVVPAGSAAGVTGAGSAVASAAGAGAAVGPVAGGAGAGSGALAAGGVGAAVTPATTLGSTAVSAGGAATSAAVGPTAVGPVAASSAGAAATPVAAAGSATAGAAGSGSAAASAGGGGAAATSTGAVGPATAGSAAAGSVGGAGVGGAGSAGGAGASSAGAGGAAASGASGAGAAGSAAAGANGAGSAGAAATSAGAAAAGSTGGAAAGTGGATAVGAGAGGASGAGGAGSAAAAGMGSAAGSGGGATAATSGAAAGTGGAASAGAGSVGATGATGAAANATDAAANATGTAANATGAAAGTSGASAGAGGGAASAAGTAASASGAAAGGAGSAAVAGMGSAAGAGGGAAGGAGSAGAGAAAVDAGIAAASAPTVMTGGLAAALSSVYGAGNARPRANPTPPPSPVDGVTVTHAELPTQVHPVVPNRRSVPNNQSPYSGSPWGAREELPPSNAYLPPPPVQPSNVVPLRRRVATGAVAAVVALLCSFGGVMLAQGQVSGDPSDVLAAATPDGAEASDGPSPIGDPPDSNTRRDEPKPDSYQIDSNAGNDYPVPIPEPRTNDGTPPGSPSKKPPTKSPSTKPTTPSPSVTTPRPTPSKTTPEPTPTEDEDEDDPTTPPPDDDPTTTPPTKGPTKGPSTPPASPTVPRTSSPATIVIPA